MVWPSIFNSIITLFWIRYHCNLYHQTLAWFFCQVLCFDTIVSPSFGLSFCHHCFDAIVWWSWSFGIYLSLMTSLPGFLRHLVGKYKCKQNADCQSCEWRPSAEQKWGSPIVFVNRTVMIEACEWRRSAERVRVIPPKWRRLSRNTTSPHVPIVLLSPCSDIIVLPKFGLILLSPSSVLELVVSNKRPLVSPYIQFRSQSITLYQAQRLVWWMFRSFWFCWDWE